MNLVADILDKEVIDRHGELVGRVDGVALELRNGKPPRIAYLEVSGLTRARRFHPRLGAWLARWRARHGPAERKPLRIPWRLVRSLGADIKVDLEAPRTPAWAWEHWVRERVIGRIPGA